MADEAIEWPEDPGPDANYSGDPTPTAGTPPPARGSATSTAPPTGAADPARGNGEPPRGQGDGDEQFIPRHRFDELNGNFTRTQAENQEIRRQLDHALRVVRAYQGRDPDARPPERQEPEDPRMGRVRGLLEKLYPGLKNLDKVIQTIEAQETQQNAVNDRMTGRTLTRALDFCATKLLGDGKKGSDLSKNSRIWLKDAFIAWVVNDPEREASFDAGEPVDLEAFWNDYHREMRQDAARAQSAELARRGVERNRLPSGGPSHAPVGSPPPQLDFQNPDEVHRAAFRGAMAASGRS